MHAFQFFARPHASHRIVRAAKHHQLRARIRGFLLQILKIHAIAPALVDQRVVDHAAAIRFHHLPEGRVHRRLDDHAIPHLRERAHAHGNGRNHAVDAGNVLRRHVPIVAQRHPALHRGKVALVGIRIAINAVFRRADNRFAHARRHREFHIRHRHGHNARLLFRFCAPLPLDRAGLAAIHQRIERKHIFHLMPFSAPRPTAGKGDFVRCFFHYTTSWGLVQDRNRGKTRRSRQFSLALGERQPLSRLTPPAPLCERGSLLGAAVSHECVLSKGFFWPLDLCVV